MGTDSSGHHVNDSGTAGVMARPIRFFPAALLVGHALDHLLPLPFAIPRIGLVRWTSAGVAAALIVVGVVVFATGVRNFSRAATPVPTNQPARVLVTTGVHGRTRNPIYLAFFLVYVGVGLAAHSEWILTLTLPLAVVVRYGVVAREEAYLERRFGDAYRDYKSHVRRWL
jgi:protein-S-isoprenylcysteine O-methyltransferase Ste14